MYIAGDIGVWELGFPLQYTWFAKLVNAKLLSMGKALDKPFFPDHGKFIDLVLENSFMKGMLYKKSQFFGVW